MSSEAVDRSMIEQIANTLRFLSADGVQKAGSGHPGMPMGAADFTAVLWSRFLRYHPRDPEWIDRDRFVLSAGHGSMLLYSILHLAGFDLSLEDLRQFRQWGSRTPGHPEYGVTPGVETTTGPLGQGFGNAVGMALAEAMLAARVNREDFAPIDHYTYAIVSDGDLMEGISAEAASLAGHLKLGKIVFFYDDNRITIEGSTDLAYSDDVRRRFEGYHWHVEEIDGHDPDAIAAALDRCRAEKERPSLIIGHTHIGRGSPNKQDTASAHGEPLGDEEIVLAKKNLGWPVEPTFYVPDEVRDFFRSRAAAMQSIYERWTADVAERRKRDAGFDRDWGSFCEGRLTADVRNALPDFRDKDAIATRNAGGEALQAVAAAVPWLVGGSADLSPSTKTEIKGGGSVAPGDFSGRNLHFGIREHAMGSIMNGIALHGGFRPYGSTFLVFSDYMRPPIRIAALSHIPAIYVFTHDSIFVGEDGPTHQPIEHVTALRIIPGVKVFRPADATETSAAWQAALDRTNGPVAIILTRQNLPILHRDAIPFEGVARGGYVLRDAGNPAAILVATGSEVALAAEAAERLESEGIAVRVVSMPCRELFLEQPGDYRREILPPGIPRIVVEAGVPCGWEGIAGPDGRILGINRFGASAPYKVLAEKFGFTAEHVADAVRETVAAP